MVKSKIKFICTSHVQNCDKNQGRWSEEEQDRFLKGCYLYKNNWKKIKEYIKTRTIPQIRSHAQKYLIRLCGKYSIKLFKKKFALSTSNKNIATVPCKQKLNFSKMNAYERNIFDMFNYYNREIIKDNNENMDAEKKQEKNVDEKNEIKNQDQKVLKNLSNNIENKNNNKVNNMINGNLIFINGLLNDSVENNTFNYYGNNNIYINNINNSININSFNQMTPLNNINYINSAQKCYQNVMPFNNYSHIYQNNNNIYNSISDNYIKNNNYSCYINSNTNNSHNFSQNSKDINISDRKNISYTNNNNYYNHINENNLSNNLNINNLNVITSNYPNDLDSFIIDKIFYYTNVFFTKLKERSMSQLNILENLNKTIEGKN